MPDEAFPTIIAAVSAILDEIDDDPDPERAYRRATALSYLGSRLLAETAIARGYALDQMLRDRGLVLGELAEIVEISTSRVSQLIIAARRIANENQPSAFPRRADVQDESVNDHSPRSVGSER